MYRTEQHKLATNPSSSHGQQTRWHACSCPRNETITLSHRGRWHRLSAGCLRRRGRWHRLSAGCPRRRSRWHRMSACCSRRRGRCHPRPVASPECSVPSSSRPLPSSSRLHQVQQQHLHHHLHHHHKEVLSGCQSSWPSNRSPLKTLVRKRAPLVSRATPFVACDAAAANGSRANRSLLRFPSGWSSCL